MFQSSYCALRIILERALCCVSLHCARVRRALCAHSLSPAFRCFALLLFCVLETFFLAVFSYFAGEGNFDANDWFPFKKFTHTVHLSDGSKTSFEVILDAQCNFLFSNRKIAIFPFALACALARLCVTEAR
jgi:hypothetical protein